MEADVGDDEYNELRNEAAAKLLEWAKFYRDLMVARGLPWDDANSTIYELVKDAERDCEWEAPPSPTTEEES